MYHIFSAIYPVVESEEEESPSAIKKKPRLVYILY